MFLMNDKKWWLGHLVCVICGLWLVSGCVKRPRVSLEIQCDEGQVFVDGSCQESKKPAVVVTGEEKQTQENQEANPLDQVDQNDESIGSTQERSQNRAQLSDKSAQDDTSQQDSDEPKSGASPFESKGGAVLCQNSEAYAQCLEQKNPQLCAIEVGCQ